MSTAELELNAWVQTQTTVDGLEAWWRLTEGHAEETPRREPEAQTPDAVAEPAPGLPEDFWQNWFGIWT